MGFLDDMILLAHPIGASLLLYWFYRQYKWKMKRIENPDLFTLENHAKTVDSCKICHNCGCHSLCSKCVQCPYSSTKFTAGLDTKQSPWMDWTTWTCFVVVYGIVGRICIKAKENGESYQHSKSKHSRAADFIIAVMTIHAFLDSSMSL